MRSAVEAIRNLSTLIRGPDEVKDPSTGSLPIPGLTITVGVEYRVNECGFLSLSAEVIRNHQFNQHTVGRNKAEEIRTQDMTATVSL